MPLQFSSFGSFWFGQVGGHRPLGGGEPAMAQDFGNCRDDE
jgi:hypothetical protein